MLTSEVRSTKKFHRCRDRALRLRLMSLSKNLIDFTCLGRILVILRAPIKPKILRILYANSSNGDLQVFGNTVPEHE